MNLLLFQKKRLSKGIRLALDFMGGNLDSRIRFSRGSNATVVGSNGLIQYAPHNLLLQSEFASGWNFSNASFSGTITAPDGTNTGRILNDSSATSAGYIYQGASVTSGVSYAWSVYAKAQDRPDINFTSFTQAGSLTFSLVGDGSYGTPTGIITGASIQKVADGWYRCTAIFTATATGSNNIGYSTNQSAYTGNAFAVWGAQLNIGSLQPYNSTSVKNLLGYSQNFENAAWTKSNSSIAASTVIGPFGFDGGEKLVENTTAGAHSTLEGYSFATTTYTYSVYAKAGERTKVRFVAATGFGGVLVDVDLITGSVSTSSAFGTGFAVVGATVTSIGTGWYRAGLTFSSTAGSGSVQAILLDASGSNSYTGDGTSGIYIFGAQLSDSASLDPYSYNPVAAPTSTAYYGPRFDYDPVTLAPKGLLIEEQRTNLLTYSSELENTAWIKLNTTVSANTTTAPDGTSAADTLIATTINAEHVIDESFSVIAGTTYTMSGYVKAAGLTSIGLRFTNASLWPLDGSPQVSFNLVTKTMTVISGQPSAYTITEVNNGWFRIAVSATCAVSGIAGARFQLVSGLSNVFLGDGSSGSYIWGAQLEAGAFPTSYIPTTSATVTRAADNASMVGSNFSSWYNQNEGTFNVNGDVVSNSGNRLYFDVGANGAFGTTAYTVQTSTYVGLLPGAAPVNMTSTVNTTTLTNKIATAMQNNNSIVAVNASLGVVDAVCTMPASATTLTIGCSQFGGTFGNYLNGHIQSIKYYPTRLPNADLQRLTR
jgi:hypothetical protein